MERQVSNFLGKSFEPLCILLCSFFLLGIFTSQAQNLDEFVRGKLYTIDTILVSGIKTFSDQTVISYSQLRKGQKINIPGDVPEQPQDQSILDTIRSYGSEGISAVREFFGLREGGDVGEYFEGRVEGKGDGMSDEIPFLVEGGDPDIAMLSKGEFVIPADVVAMLGNGSSDAGSDKLDDFLEDTREEAFGRKEKQKQIDAEKGLSSLA